MENVAKIKDRVVALVCLQLITLPGDPGLVHQLSTANNVKERRCVLGNEHRSKYVRHVCEPKLRCLCPPG